MVPPGSAGARAAMDDDISVWSPLDSSRSQIRLFRLEPNADLHAWPVGQFEVISLDDEPNYEAISYAWGGPQGVHPVFINGLELPITENLCGALRHLRYTLQPRDFWVDAICISQRDLQERAQQVALMQRIFRQAHTVHAWLGHGFESTEHVLRRLQQVAQATDSQDSGIPRHAESLLHFDDQFREGLEKLSRVDFWNRLWVTQEIVLAKAVSIRYGRVGVSLSSFNTYIPNPLNIQMDRGQYLTRTTDLLMTLLSLTSAPYNLSHLTMLQRQRILLAFFSRARMSIVTDPRDRVYGLLGICSEYVASGFIEPNYALDTASVYTLFARRVIRWTKSLLVVSQATPCHNALAELPSWVPDWSSSYDHKLHGLFLARWRAYCAFPESRSQIPEFATDGDVLRTIGVLCCSVSEIGEVYYPRPYSVSPSEISVTTIRQWLTLYERYVAPLIHEGDAGPKTHEGFVRTILWDTCRGYRKTPYEGFFGPPWEYTRLDEGTSVFSMVKVFGMLLAGDPMAKERLLGKLARLAVDGDVEKDFLNNRFLITSNGLPGMGPRNTKVGDTVAVLSGANMPFVLRKATSPHCQNAYTVVGVCYVHGIMDGEGVVGPNAGKVEEISLI